MVSVTETVKERKYCFLDVETTGLDDDDQPIEVGLVLVDSKFTILDTLSIVIAQDGFGEHDYWSNHATEAFKVHGISYDEMYSNGLVPLQAEKWIKSFVDRNDAKNAVLISDNAKFDWFHLNKIIKVENFFHYCVWDTSLLFSFLGKEDPPMKHRALADALIIYEAVKREFLEADRYLEFV